MYKSTFKVGLCIIVILSITIVEIRSSETSDTAEAKKTNTTASEKKPSNSVTFMPVDELSWKNEIGHLLSFSGLVVSGLVIIGVFVWLLGPLFGYRICSVLGTCEPEVTPYQSGGGNLQDFSQANIFSSPYANPYGYNYGGEHRKRSLNYLGPIIKTLASAYEKYGESSTVPSKEK